MSRCKYWDCGWCYAPNDTAKNSVNGACLKPNECKELKAQTENNEHRKAA